MRGDTGNIHPAPAEVEHYLDRKFTIEEPKGKSILECTAADLVRDHGEGLVGRRVWTPRNGGWPGGLARVTELYHDPAAPEILFQVEGLEPTFKYPDDDKTTGMFDYEICYLLTETQTEERE